MIPSSISKPLLAILRIALGWMFFYAGVVKLMDPAWSAAGYLQGAKTFPALFHWFASPSVLPVTNLLNEWGLTLIGLSLMLGALVRFSAPLGALMMALYYLVPLEFPHPNANAFIVDQHIIYIVLLLFFAASSAGRFWGLDAWHRRAGQAS
ncbi:MAG: DoxX family protein [Candidatus Yanofskybacteria bacterium]|nr:DoxX family protein [Candidatus Yanofskybacteria bacterium]